jgi:hypothetical protein
LLAVTAKSETWRVVLREERGTFYNKRKKYVYCRYQFEVLYITAGLALRTEGGIISLLKEKLFCKTAVQVVVRRPFDCCLMQIIQLLGTVFAKITTTFLFCAVIRPCLAEDRLLQLSHEECDVMAFGK